MLVRFEVAARPRVAGRRAGRRSPRPVPPRSRRPGVARDVERGCGPRPAARAPRLVAVRAATSRADRDPCARTRPVVGPAGDRDPAVADAGFVGARERAVRHCAGVVGCRRAAGSSPSTLVVEQPGRQAVDRGLDLRDVEVDAAAGAAAVQQRRRERGRHEPGRERVGDRAVRADRFAIGPTRERVVARRAPSPDRRSRDSRLCGPVWPFRHALTITRSGCQRASVS